MSLKKCEVVLDQKSKYIDKLFSYETNLPVKPGDIVIVPFGRGNKAAEAIVIKTKDIEEAGENPLKQITRISDEKTGLDEVHIDMALWIRSHYMSSYLEAVSLFYPSNIRTSKPVYDEIIRLKDEKSLKDLIGSTKKNAFVKLSLYQYILENVCFPREELKKHLEDKSYSSYLNELCDKNIITIEVQRKYREIKSDYKTHSISGLKLNSYQKEAVDVIRMESENDNRTILLRGVTGSGKTEIYMEVIESALKKGKGAIVLVPEISLTPQTISRFKSRFKDLVAVIHSHLSSGERFDEWSRIGEMRTPVVIGARSALFSPVAELGAIIVDECHDDAYKSEQNPKYYAVEVAEKIKEARGCILILGSATPSVDQYHMAKQNKYKLVEIEHRANSLDLPSVEVVDMIDDAKTGNLSFLSRKLQKEIKNQFEDKKQVILFLNRRGYASFLSCNSCGHVPKCKNCDISLTYHKKNNVLRCHYCDYKIEFTASCPECSENGLKDMGIGTEKIESEINELFPSAKVYRMDKDTVTKKGDHQRILSGFRDSESAVLIGTQMIGKGLDFPRVGLVGVINIDQGINAPDFRSSERSFSLVEQVGGRAGRGDKTGKVIIQTLRPDHYILQYLKNHDYRGFYEEEIKLRKSFEYLPFGNIIRILISSTVEKNAAVSSMKIKDAMGFYFRKKSIDEYRIMGPYPCLISRIENKYRWQLMIKDTDIEIQLIKSIINYILTEKRKVVLCDNVHVSVDINPANMI